MLTFLHNYDMFMFMYYVFRSTIILFGEYDENSLPPPRRLCFTWRLSLFPSFCLSVCLSVCLSATSLHVITTDWIFVQILPEMHHLTRKNWLNSVSHPSVDRDLGFLKIIFQHCEIRQFSTIWLALLEKLIG